MNVSSKNQFEMELSKSLLEMASAGSDNFTYNKGRGILLIGRGVNAVRNKAIPTDRDDGGNAPEVKELE
ncbi:hypothetical protein DFW101_2935 [Solidesulfovibrio carbinoliphilus subsp. oakridgensis]|uniref:Uncharacterized protein n=1 Tax=Solidesulfovibrio carbinoliphilus subsp. oakridgensis TaxID=694327 RepID=G7Q5D6_9BACT|nr:hypothetical protein [Solidesulfovibrio carbinoliphilus]EHJ48937.1 hypothetical protein DFW101_2935 [Solidesulfovibrio carbinoliphilus subsp. oakridgensis]